MTTAAEMKRASHFPGHRFMPWNIIGPGIRALVREFEPSIR